MFDCLNAHGGSIVHTNELKIAPPPSPMSLWKFANAASPFDLLQKVSSTSAAEIFYSLLSNRPCCLNFFYIYCAALLCFWLRQKTFEMQIDVGNEAMPLILVHTVIYSLFDFTCRGISK